MGRWAKRAKAAYARQCEKLEHSSPSHTLNGEDNPRGTLTPFIEKGNTVGTLNHPHSPEISKGSTNHCKTKLGKSPDRGAQKAYKAHKGLGFSSSPPERGYVLVDAVDGLELVIEDLKHSKMVGLDLETTGLCWWQEQIRLVSITTESEKTYVVDAFKVDIKPLVPALKNTEIIAHNALFDLLFLHRMGLETTECACTMVLSQILWAGKLKPHSENNVDHDLASVVKRALGEQLDKEKQKADWSGELTSEMLDYAAKDSQVLLRLYRELMRRIKEAGQMGWVLDIEMRLLKAMVHISDNGLPVDRDKWAEYVQVIIEEKETLVSDMDALITQPLPKEFLERNKKKGDRADKVNWQSNQQAAWVIEECHGITLPLTKKGNPSIGKDALKNIDHPLASLLARFNQIKNTAAIFGKALEERYANGRMHGGLKQCEADTGRMSCANPPLQGVPSKGDLRKAIVAPEGYRLVVSDLSQIEIRILAALSEDQTLIRAFKGGADIHRSVAATVLGKNEEDVTDEERKIAKSIVFGQMYGQGVDGLRRNIQNRLGREREFSQAEAQEYWDGFFDAYPGVKRWRKKESRAFDAGSRYTRTLKGRRRLDVDTKSKRWNTPIQGLAADVLKAIAVTVYERREEILSLQMVGLVHDEVILLVLEEHVVRAAKWLTEIMEGVGDSVVNGDRSLEDRVPIKADTSVCKSWGDK